MWYIGSQDAFSERVLSAINPHQGIPELDYTVRPGDREEPLYFHSRKAAEDALKLFKAWCKRNYGQPQQKLLPNPQIIEVPQAQFNLF
jgi:hypothetical protein